MFRSASSCQNTGETPALGTLRQLEVIRRRGNRVRPYQAATSEICGEPEESLQTEQTPLRPGDPYELHAYSLAGPYSRSRGPHVSYGIPFNHLGQFRAENCATRKIERAAAEIAAGRATELVPGTNSEARRDWGFAGDHVEAMNLIVQATRPRTT